MNGEQTIIVQPRRQDFEEIYFSGNQGNLFFSPTTRGKTMTTLVIGAILLIVFIFRNDFSGEKSGILYFVSFLFLLCVIFLSVSINKVSRWKKQVGNYLSKLEICRLYEIRFTGTDFKVIIDDQEETSEWKDFGNVEVNEQYITLEGKYSYMFPKKSMSGKDYQLLKSALKEHITA